MLDKIIINGNNNRTICIDAAHATISTNAPGGVYPVMKLSHNNGDVLKVNKTTISTCNIEFLAHALKTNYAAFNAVYGYIYGVMSFRYSRVNKNHARDVL